MSIKPSQLQVESPASTNQKNQSRSAVGLSLEESSGVAGRVAAESALAALNGTELCYSTSVDAAIVFATAAHDHAELLRSVRAVLGDIPMVGCSGEGVISGNESLERDFACSVMVIRSSELRFHTYVFEEYAEDSAKVGPELAAQVNADANGEPAVLMLFPDGLTGDCSAMMEGLNSMLSSDVTVVGGAAADGMQFERTYQYAFGRAISGGLTAMLIAGGPRVEVALSHGCTPLGSTRTITKGGDGWVHEIDNTPAWDVLRTYLSGDPQDLNAQGIVHLCLGIPIEGGNPSIGDNYTVRTPLDLDKSTGALRVPGGGLETGTSVRMMRRDPVTIRHSIDVAAQRMAARLQGQEPLMVLQFDCAGRGRILFGGCASDELVRPLRQVLGSSVPWIGFHTYGEIAPIHGETQYHNYTAAVCAIMGPDQARHGDE